VFLCGAQLVRVLTNIAQQPAWTLSDPDAPALMQVNVGPGMSDLDIPKRGNVASGPQAALGRRVLLAPLPAIPDLPAERAVYRRIPSAVALLSLWITCGLF